MLLRTLESLALQAEAGTRPPLFKSLHSRLAAPVPSGDGTRSTLPNHHQHIAPHHQKRKFNCVEILLTGTSTTAVYHQKHRKQSPLSEAEGNLTQTQMLQLALEELESL